MDKRKIPNYLTYGRIAAIFPICLLMGVGTPGAIWAAFVLYALAAATDWLDGYLSRKWNVVSEIGRFLDPIADKLLIAAVLFMLVANDTLTGVMIACPILILLREIFVAGLREYLGPKNVIVPVTMMAKLKTTVQLVACGVLIAAPALAGVLTQMVGIGLLVCATILTVGSGWQYWQSVAPHFREDKA